MNQSHLKNQKELTMLTKGSKRMVLLTNTSSCQTKAYTSLRAVPIVFPSILPFSARDSSMWLVASLISAMKSIRQNCLISSGKLKASKRKLIIKSTVSGGKKMVMAVAKKVHMPSLTEGKSALSKIKPQSATGSWMYMSKRTSVHSAPDFCL